MTTQHKERAADIAKRYDDLRATIPCISHPDQLLVSRGVYALGPEVVTEVLEKVKHFKDFNKGNDPWHEHDFGNFEHCGREFFFKIDDYTTDPSENYRFVLTVMLASEY